MVRRLSGWTISNPSRITFSIVARIEVLELAFSSWADLNASQLKTCESMMAAMTLLGSSSIDGGMPHTGEPTKSCRSFGVSNSWNLILFIKSIQIERSEWSTWTDFATIL